MRRRSLIALIAIPLLALVIYFAISAVIYNQLSAVDAKCAAREGEGAYTPANFSSRRETFDHARYFMPEYEEITFPSREDDITISAFYIEAQGVADPATAPAVIIVHGVQDCKRRAASLIPAGMLTQHGFNALVMDMRDHGDSEVEDGRQAGGTEEYLDVLGAWDYLVETRGLPAEKVGLFGYSLGAATSMIAFGEEPRVAAVWEDAGFASIRDIVESELRRGGYPTFLAGGAGLMGQIIVGDDIYSRSPLDAMAKVDGRPIFIVHGDSDDRVSVEYASDLAAAIRADGGEVEPWIVPGSEHIEVMFDYPEEYEEKLIAFFQSALE